MVRIVFGVIGGFVGWMIAGIGSEKIVGAMWPAFGDHQRAFEGAIKNEGPFTANATMLATHVVLAAIVSVMAGSLAALIAAESMRAPLLVGVVLLALGLLKAGMSWQHVPLWYHAAFTLVLLPMAVIGGKLAERALLTLG
jgi:hypothetical protein